MMPLLLATGNRGKLREISAVFADLNFLQLHSLAEMDSGEEVRETGRSFLQNARIKARTYRQRLKIENIMAEDSGLEVFVLGKRPGVFSARFAGENATDADNIRKLLQELAGMERREARFVSVIVAIFADDCERSFRGEAAGAILHEPRGHGGFGYDPVFFYPPLQKSFAELSLAEKNRVSHRARALAAMRRFLLAHQGGASARRLS